MLMLSLKRSKQRVGVFIFDSADQQRSVRSFGGVVLKTDLMVGVVSPLEME
jgi:hypothetical protein